MRVSVWLGDPKTVYHVPKTPSVVKMNFNDLKQEKSKNLSVLAGTLPLMQRAPIVTAAHTMQLKTSIPCRQASFSKSGLRITLKKMPPRPEPMVVMPIARPLRRRNQWLTTAVEIVVMKARQWVAE